MQGMFKFRAETVYGTVGLESVAPGLTPDHRDTSLHNLGSGRLFDVDPGHWFGAA